jgi:hypothetical protein
VAVGRIGAELKKMTNSDIAYDYREFGGLRPMERRYLEQWRRAARVLGIDAVEDLAQLYASDDSDLGEPS